MSVLFQGTDLNLQIFITFWDSIHHILFLIFLFSLGIILIKKATGKIEEDEDGSDYEDDTLSDQSEDDSDEVWLNNEEESGTDCFSQTCRLSYLNEFRQKESQI